MKPTFLVSALALFLAGCASRADREALRQCSFTPRATQRLAGPGDSLVVALALEIQNPGPSAAILDSFVATASTNKPLARFSHGKTLRIAPGRTDTATLRFAMANQDLMATAFTFMAAPPDSIGLEGVAWVPNFFGMWTNERRFKARIPFQAVSARMNEIFRSRPSP